MTYCRPEHNTLSESESCPSLILRIPTNLATIPKPAFVTGRWTSLGFPVIVSATTVVFGRAEPSSPLVVGKEA